ncbi:MAG: cyclic nucleotide-binding domain-containing protein [Candidatus Omnitrophica bacterium]|nr:cyclic nucleotide-binding domain-containing protein [Candidatus Omnitrophota bacterium]
MKTKSLEELIAEAAFFKDLDPSYRQMLAGCGTNVVYKPGEFIFREGDESRQFYLIRTGSVALEINLPGKGAMIIQTLNEGEVLGWSCLIPPYRKHFDGRSVKQTRAIAFDGACIGKKCEEDAKLGYEFFRRFAGIMAQRLSATRLQLLDVYAKP